MHTFIPCPGRSIGPLARAMVGSQPWLAAAILVLGCLPCVFAQAVSTSPVQAHKQEQLPEAPRPHNVYPVRGVQNTWVPALGPPFLVSPCTVGACVVKARQTHVCCERNEDSFRQYLREQRTHIYTPRQLAIMAAKGVIDPFNLITIEGLAAIDTASNSHSVFGPGMKGFARLSGVSITEDMTDEFFGTFLIPSIDHQDPHYLRMPNEPIRKRILHTITQIFWTRSDTDRPMFNYSNMVGSVAEEGVAAAYVPYQRTGWGPAAQRLALGYAFDPIGNMVTEFLPDVAKHVNFHVVFVQQIIYKAALSETQ